VARDEGRESLAAQLSVTIDLVKQAVAQTRAPVVRGDTHFPGKAVRPFDRLRGV
jgi:hypothetical protein